MALYYWIGGTGSTSQAAHWSATSGGAAVSVAPGPTDGWVFDANSGTGTVTMDTAGVINSTTGAVTTFSCASVAFGKAGLTLLLAAPFAVNGDVGHTGGTIDTSTSSYACAWVSYTSSNTNTRALNLNGSTMWMSGTAIPWSLATSTGMTLTRGTSLIVLMGLGFASFTGGGLSYYDVRVSNVGSGAVSLTGGNTYHNLTILGGNSKVGQVSMVNCTVENLLTITGQSPTNRLLVNSTNSGTRRTITAGASPVLSNVSFQDISAAGAGAPFAGTNLGDALGNQNINTTNPMTLYRSGAGGNWSDLAWSATSGGNTTDPDINGQIPRVPLPQDTVYVDSGATGTIVADMPRMGRSVDFTGFTGTWNAATANTVLGQLTLSNAPGFSITGTGTLTLNGRGAQLLTSAGKTFTQGIKVDAPNGSYAIQDALICAGDLALLTGGFITNDFDVTTFSFTSLQGSPVRSLILGGTTWRLTGTGAVLSVTNNTALVITPGTSTFRVTDTTATLKTFAGNGRTYGSLFLDGGNVAISGSNSFTNFAAQPGTTITVTAGTTQSISGAFNVSGVLGNLVIMQSTVSGSPFSLSKVSGLVNSDYLSLKDSTATGGAAWYAGAHSTNVSGNSGWLFLTSSGGAHRMMALLGRPT